jgi:hypothetical protein
MAESHSFLTVFAVPMVCEACVKAVSDAVRALGGITSVEASLEDQLVSVEGSGMSWFCSIASLHFARWLLDGFMCLWVATTVETNFHVCHGPDNAPTPSSRLLRLASCHHKAHNHP